jgi:NADPH-dependent curcumin reductase
MVAHFNRRILLKSRPEGAPSLDNFTLKQGSVPEPGDGEVLMRTRAGSPSIPICAAA